jgi:predicted O-methyltransferase YrrM
VITNRCRPEPGLPPLLEQLLDTDHTTENGAAVALHSHIPRDYAIALAETVGRYRPRRVLEVGMAFGIASLAMLGAIEALGEGALISVDPFQTADYRGLGVRHVELAGLAHRHRLIEECDYLALPGLVRDEVRLQLAYIDGWHTFDHVLLDLFYIDKMLDIGGVMAFNDCGMPSVHRAIRFLETHRSYKEIDVGLPRNYVGTSRADTVKRTLERRSHADRYFAKVDEPEPPWNFYAKFA